MLSLPVFYQNFSHCKAICCLAKSQKSVSVRVSLIEEEAGPKAEAARLQSKLEQLSWIAMCRNACRLPENPACKYRAHARLLRNHGLGLRQDSYSHPLPFFRGTCLSAAWDRAGGPVWEDRILGASRMISLTGKWRLNFTAARRAPAASGIKHGSLSRSKVKDALANQSILNADMFKTTSLSMFNKSRQPSPRGIVGMIHSTEAEPGKCIRPIASHATAGFLSKFSRWEFQARPASPIVRGGLSQ